MKTALAVVVALLAGLVIGSFSVKSDLRQAQVEIQSLQKQLQSRSRRADGVRNITSFLRMPAAASVDTNTPAATPDEVETNTPPAESPAAQRESFDQQLKTATELWKTRSQVARTTFIGNINAGPVQVQLFDQAVATMNQQLGDKIRQWADYLKQNPTFTPETGMRMMNDLSGPVIAGYDELDRVLAAGWREQAGEQFQLFDFINPEVALPLAGVSDVFEKRRHR